MKHGSLFSGIGGFDLAAQWMEWENVFQVENDKFCIKALEKNFPNVKRYGDIKEFDGTKYRGLIDILTGGFPCQGFSVAGKQRGKSDPRWLWPEMLRVIREVQPPWVVGENVPGIIKLALEDICLALEGEGYEVQPFIIPSASIGAWDKRDRVWIIAYNQEFRDRRLSIQQRGQNKADNINPDREIEVNPDSKSSISEQSRKTRTGRDRCSNSIGDTISKGLQRYSGDDLSGRDKEQERQAGIQIDKIASDTISIRRENGLSGGEPERETGKHIHSFKEPDWWNRNWIEVASELCGSNARVSHRMDRIKAVGNSVNPYVVYEIFKVIEQMNNIT